LGRDDRPPEAVRLALLVPVLVTVMVASALNLVLGGLWVLAFLALLACRRRTAWLVLLGSLALAVAAGALGGLRPPEPASYAAAEVGWLTARLGGGNSSAGPEHAAADAAGVARRRLVALRQEELAGTTRQLERRARVAVAASRELARLRGRAPDEIAAAEEAVRRLALTLTAPEFRDLDARRARLAEWLDALEARLAAARDDAEVSAVERALQPATLAPVSLRALRADLAGAETGIAAALRALAGAGVTAAASVRMAYDEPGRLLVAETRQVLETGGALRIVRLDLRGFDRGGVALSADGAPPRPVADDAEVALPSPGAGRVAVVDRRAWPARPQAVRPPLRLVSFVRLVVPSPGAGDLADVPVTVALDGGRGPEIPLVVAAGRPRLDAIDLPRHAFHYTGRPGRLERGADRDTWAPAGAGDLDGVTFELVPPGPAFRNGAFERLKDYVYTPNAAAALGCLGLAALAVVLARRRPRRPAPAPAR
jgi:hypothetical protein